MKKMICFDMDGTIADLYGVPNWLEKIRAEDASPYRDAKPMWDMEKLKEVLLKLSAESWEIRVITWLSMDSTEEFKKVVRAEKRAWLNRYEFPVGSCHMVAYGTTKANCIRKSADHAILIDDNSKIRDNWSLGRTIDPAEGNLIEELEKLLEN